MRIDRAVSVAQEPDHEEQTLVAFNVVVSPVCGSTVTTFIASFISAEVHVSLLIVMGASLP